MQTYQREIEWVCICVWVPKSWACPTNNLQCANSFEKLSSNNPSSPFSFSILNFAPIRPPVARHLLLIFRLAVWRWHIDTIDACVCSMLVLNFPSRRRYYDWLYSFCQIPNVVGRRRVIVATIFNGRRIRYSRSHAHKFSSLALLAPQLVSGNLRCRLSFICVHMSGEVAEAQKNVKILLMLYECTWTRSNCIFRKRKNSH